MIMPQNSFQTMPLPHPQRHPILRHINSKLNGSGTNAHKRCNPRSHMPCTPSVTLRMSLYTSLGNRPGVQNEGSYRASSNSSKPFSNILCLLYCSKNAFLLRRRSNWSNIRLNSWVDTINIYGIRYSLRKKSHRSNTRVVRQHQTADTMICCDIWRPARQGDLDWCRTPRNKVGQLPFPNAKEWLMHLMNRNSGITSMAGVSYTVVLMLTSVGSTSPWMMFKMEM